MVGLMATHGKVWRSAPGFYFWAYFRAPSVRVALG
jgi:hypothetical protein